MKDATVSALLALVPDPEPCPVCRDRRALLATRLLSLPCLAVVACPACDPAGPAIQVLDTTDPRGDAA